MRGPRLLFLCLLGSCSEAGPPADGADAVDARVRPRADAGQPQRDAGGIDASRPGEPARDAGARGDAAGAEAGDAARPDGASPRYAVSRLASPPSYQGSVDNSAACSRSYPTAGFVPTGTSERFPLFLYFVGTAFVADDASARVDSAAPMAVSEAMARRGFVALSVRYDNTPLAWLSDHQNQLRCLFAADKPESLIAAACALPQVDCALGIATWGHSQGALVAHRAHDLEPRVRAVWTTGYGGEASAKLDTTRLRVANGEADGDNGSAATVMRITGLTAADCKSPDACFRAGGSGWTIVRKKELTGTGASADHCWFDRPSCSASTLSLEPTWVDPSSTRSYALESSADWVAATLRRP